MRTRTEGVAEPTNAEGEGDEEPATSPGPVDDHTARAGRPVPTKYVIIVLSVFIAAIVILFMFFPLISSAAPPVDVYSKPVPPDGIDVLSILPESILGHPLSQIQCQNATYLNITTCWYDGGIVVEAQNYSSVRFAQSYLSASCGMWEAEYNVTGHESGDEYWYAFSGPEYSVFSWQKGIWVFFVKAPDDTTRNAAADQLPY